MHRPRKLFNQSSAVMPKWEKLPSDNNSSDLPLIDISGDLSDNLKLQDIAERFARSIEIDHPGFGVIFKEEVDPVFTRITITPAEVAQYTIDPHSIHCLGLKKRIE